MRKLSILLLLAACSPCDDAGRILHEGTPLYADLPVKISCETRACAEALAWWGEQGDMLVADPAGVSVRYCDLPPGTGGTCESLATWEGRIVRSWICIEREFRGHWAEPYITAHEMGHALGLADDPPDCRSVMSEGKLQLLDNVQLTAKDRALLW